MMTRLSIVKLGQREQTVMIAFGLASLSGVAGGPAAPESLSAASPESPTVTWESTP